MKRIVFAAAVVQLTTLLRPIAGTGFYLASRGSLDRQRAAVQAAITGKTSA